MASHGKSKAVHTLAEVPEYPHTLASSSWDLHGLTLDVPHFEVLLVWGSCAHVCSGQTVVEGVQLNRIKQLVRLEGPLDCWGGLGGSHAANGDAGSIAFPHRHSSNTVVGCGTPGDLLHRLVSIAQQAVVTPP